MTNLIRFFFPLFGKALPTFDDVKLLTDFHVDGTLGSLEVPQDRIAMKMAIHKEVVYFYKCKNRTIVLFKRGTFDKIKELREIATVEFDKKEEIAHEKWVISSQKRIKKEAELAASRRQSFLSRA